MRISITLLYIGLLCVYPVLGQVSSSKLELEALRNTNIQSPKELYVQIQIIDSLLNHDLYENKEWIDDVLQKSISLGEDSAFYEMGGVYSGFLLKENRKVDYYLVCMDQVEFTKKKPLSMQSGMVYNDAGIAHNKIGDPDMALGYLKKSYYVFEKLELDQFLTYPLGNMAKVYFDLGKYDQALAINRKTLQRSLKIQDTTEKDYNLIFDYFHLAKCYVKKNDMKEALKFFLLAMKTGEKYPGEAYSVYPHTCYLQFLLELEKYEELKAAIVKAETLLNKIPHPSAVDRVTFQLANSYDALINGREEEAINPDSLLHVEVSEEVKKLVYKYAIDYFELKDDPASFINFSLKSGKNKYEYGQRQFSELEAIEKEFAHQKLQREYDELKAISSSTRYNFALAMSLLILALAIIGFLVFYYLKAKSFSQTLYAKNQKILKQQQELEQMTYVTTHDLKEPANTISSFSKLLDEKYRQDFPEPSKPILDIISQTADNMMSSVKNLHNYLLLGNERKLEYVNLNELLGSVIHNLADTVEKKKAIILYHGLPTIKCYPAEMQCLFQNLFSNSLKYSIEGENPFIEVEYRNGEDFHRFIVSDNGMGIEKKQLTRIFKPFARTKIAEREEGYGIGLAAVNKIVGLHDGTIYAESEPGHGSTFHFTIRKKLKDETSIENNDDR